MIRIIVGALVFGVIGSHGVLECRAQPHDIYVPPAYAVTITPQTNGEIVSVAVRVDLPDTCRYVGSWGQPVIQGNTVFVDAEFLEIVRVCHTVIVPVRTQYDLGHLSPGNYNFVFAASQIPIKSQAFSVPEPAAPLLSIRVSQVELSWPTDTNGWYQLQYRSTLTTNQWTPLTAWIRGNGEPFSTNHAVPVGQAQTFYQVARTNAAPP